MFFRKIYKKRRIIKCIKLIRKEYGKYYNSFAGCFEFHLLLKDIFGGMGYYDNNHVITKIHDTFYDINGVVKKNDVNGYLPIVPYFGYNFMYKIFTKEHHNEK